MDVLPLEDDEDEEDEEDEDDEEDQENEGDCFARDNIYNPVAVDIEQMNIQNEPDEEVGETPDDMTYLAQKLILKQTKKNKNSVHSKIDTIVQTARWIVNNCQQKNDGWCYQKKNEIQEFYYGSGIKRLTYKEYLYYRKRITARGVLTEIHKDAEKILELYHRPFTLLPLATMPESFKEGFNFMLLISVLYYYIFVTYSYYYIL